MTVTGDAVLFDRIHALYTPAELVYITPCTMEQQEGSLYLACNDRNAFFTSEEHKRFTLWSWQTVYDPLTLLLDNIYIRFGAKLYRQIVGFPMGTNCAPLVVDLFLFCYERDFMLSLSGDKESYIIEAFNSTSRYLDDLLNIDNAYFDGMVNQIYPVVSIFNLSMTSYQITINQ